VGQQLANGQVLEIEINEGGDPIVILEQYGIEVSRAVGTATNYYSCYQLFKQICSGV